MSGNLPITVQVSGEDVTVDLLAWRRHQRPTPGLVEQILELNPGLAAKGPVLPVGTRVYMPGVQADGATDRALIQLWD